MRLSPHKWIKISSGVAKWQIFKKYFLETFLFWIYFHFVVIIMISQCNDTIFALYKIKKYIIKLSTWIKGYQNMQMNYFFFVNFTCKTKESQSQCLCLIFLMLTLKRVLFCVCHIHRHMISQPLYSVSFWDMSICRCWGTEVAKGFFPCVARLWNSIATCIFASFEL